MSIALKIIITAMISLIMGIAMVQTGTDEFNDRPIWNGSGLIITGTSLLTIIVCALIIIWSM